MRDYVISVTGNGSASDPNVYGKLLGIALNTGTSATRSVSFSAAAGNGFSVSLGPYAIGTGGAQYRPRLQNTDPAGVPIAGEYSELLVCGQFTLTVTGAAVSEVTTATIYVE